MPVRAVVEVRQDQSYEVVVLLLATLHDLEHAEQTHVRFLSDDVLAVGQFLHDLRNVPPECQVVEAPIL